MRLDLVADLQQVMMKELPTRSARERDAFAALDVGEQTWRFLNWQSRLVHPHPRQVYRAIGFEQSPTFAAHKAEVNLLLAKLAAGVDVTQHLSRHTKEGYCLHLDGRKHGNDFDLLLNEWGIHHLHIPSQRKCYGANRHSDVLLFSIVLPGAVYAVALGGHREWTEPKLVQEVVHSWPDKQFFVSLNVLPGTAFTPSEHQKLRQAGMTTSSVVGEVVYISGLTCGLSTALVSTRISQEAGRLLNAVHQMSRDPSDLLLQMRKEAKLMALRWPRRPHVRVIRSSAAQRWAFGFLEEASGATLAI